MEQKKQETQTEETVAQEVATQETVTFEFEKLEQMVTDVWGVNVMGSDVGTLVTALGILLFFMILRGPFSRFIIQRFRKISDKTKNDWDDALIDAVEQPISLVPVVLGLYVATAYIDPEGRLAQVIYNIEKSLIAIVLFWVIYNAVSPITRLMSNLEKIFSKAMVAWLRKGLKLFVFLLGLATILELWGIKVAPLIAGFGLFGVAVALGAQDMFKNLIAGLTVIAEKRFHPGDWIKIDGVVEGTVEDIGFRSTLVRRFDKAPVHVPNTSFADRAVTNFSAMTHRRIYWKIGVLYSSSVDQLKTIRDGIENYVLNNDDFAKPPEVATFVRIDAFNASSIDIMLYCFTKTTDWGQWLEIKEELAYNIKKIVEEAGSDFAFPSTTVYLESNGADQPEDFVPPKK